jgi:siroheme synthase-like protein
LIDIFLEGRKVIVVGGGIIGERKTLQLLDSGAEVTIVGQKFTKKLMNLSEGGHVKLEKKAITDELLLSGLKIIPSIVIVALNNKSLNEKVAKELRMKGALVCVVDNPSFSDFAMPAVAKVGDIRVAVSTKGKSPAMASVIRRRVEKMITVKDIRWVEIQSYARVIAKNNIPSPNERRKVLLQIIDNNEMNMFLDNNQINEAKDLAKRIIMRVENST